MPSLFTGETPFVAIAIELSANQALAASDATERLQVSETELAAAAVSDLVAQPRADFDSAA
jgi:hypothetical protein